MPNIQSARKRMKQDVLRRARNDRRTATMKTTSKAFIALIEENKKAEAEKMLPMLYKALDKAGKHNTIHPNKASRQKARFARMLAGVASAKS
ncbi:MAG: 30S ribosomal protein S20 [Parcubacteria group bacterium RIFCSPHIGHO2_01_FULL_47_10b]|nr:MAG: 30S ribosomal protein S20 [Parcubacteria group bacterium RIFCSPHIGHO2_01_FULL_47_10b]